MSKKNTLSITPVILCGGSGTRLWPLSRSGFPKQFLVLSGTTSLFQQAVERVNGLTADDIVVGETLLVSNEEHRFLILDQLREISTVSAQVLLEPVGRNTAPALTLAALQAIEADADAILVVTPADQTISDNKAFTRALQNSVRAASSGAIVILGIAPLEPKTGYGYIKYQGGAGANDDYVVAQFVEKPDILTAQGYIESGNFAWNSGMFVLKAATWLNALKHFRPDILVATEKSWITRSIDLQFVRPDKDAFTQIPSDSVDYAVIERCPGSEFVTKMVPLDAGWSDLGTWDAVWEACPQDQNGNAIHGDTLTFDTTNTLIHASSRLVGTVGVDNLIVIETVDAVLVVDKSQSQHIKRLVDELEAQERTEHILSRKVHRPWGYYDSIDEGERFKVKHIQVNPGASLSLQKHAHRSEHWIVVKGTAEVTCGDKQITLTENQSTYIPLGEIHRLANRGSTPLEIIEVQSGSYLGEDDIVRIEDIYGRTKAV